MLVLRTTEQLVTEGLWGVLLCLLLPHHEASPNGAEAEPDGAPVMLWAAGPSTSHAGGHEHMGWQRGRGGECAKHP